MKQARPVRDPPTAEQRRAADPRASAWVSASAGTGKTRVLADRVLRLLLQGAAPERILCLTFTKAGAAEMVGRIEGDLARFAALAEDDLARELFALLGRAADAGEAARARGLLAEILDLPGGLGIMTIHSFCQSLLRRFPLEAGIAPHFEVLEPRDADELMAQALDAVLEAPGELQGALRVLAVLVGEGGFKEGLDALRQHRLRFDQALERCDGSHGLIRAVAAALGVDPTATLEQLRLEACSGCTESPGLAAACRALESGGKHERAAAPVIAAWLAADLDERLAALDEYKQVFLTKTGTPHNHFLTKSVRLSAPAAVAALQAEQTRLAAFVERVRAVEVFERSRALIEVGAAALEEYQARKRARATLDYDDLIERSVDLLNRAGIAPWIQYKLDQRIDHLLVDEGQDTNPAQWAVLEALIADFFTGEGAADTERTAFVVGDEKQSIFSFQGADLETYRAMHGRLKTRVRDARRRFHEASLTRSFRSVEAVLEVVDRVFAEPEAARGLTADGVVPAHESARAREPGTVELWPLIEVESTPEPATWELPDRPDPVASPERALAEMVAARIFGWLGQHTVLPSSDQPIRPGDVMVLLRSRTSVRDYLSRELKRLGVPVAGADRLRLIDEIAVLDLIALGEALLLPEDDLTLAAVLKSPLIGLEEEQLFELAHGREGRPLHRRFGEWGAEGLDIRSSLDLFQRLHAEVDRMPPFEFYARLLADGGRRRLLARLGPAAAEPIDAFLAQALAYERTHPPSLQGFLHWMRQDTSELVRDPDQPRDEVRILTVHGAKGLEAPIVIIPDAASKPPDKDRLLWLDGGLPLWKVGKERQDPVSRRQAEIARERQLEEERRLLYVAMTRARDWLIVAGWRRRNQARGAAVWYDLVRAGLEAHPDVERMSCPNGGSGQGLRLRRTRRQAGLPLGEPVAPRPEPPPLPAFAWQPAPDEPLLGSPLSPSRLTEDEPATSPPAGPATEARFGFGRAVHRLLQILPDLPQATRLRAAERLVTRSGIDLEPAARAQAIRDALRLIDDPRFAPLFGPGSRAEVPVVGVVGGVPVSGQIDRLVITPEEVLLVDYKTSRTRPDEVPLAYLRQLALYRHLLLTRFGRTVRCALLWTGEARLDLVDEATLEAALPSIGSG